MHANRAEEIMHSPFLTEVLYRSSPIWIDHIDKERNIAQVTYLEKGNTVEVSITQLDEKGLAKH